MPTIAAKPRKSMNARTRRALPKPPTRAPLEKKTPTKARAAYHHGDLPRALVTAALEIISKEGADGFTLREAARLVGVTHGAAYRHFADKTALLAVLAEEGFRELVAATETARAAVGDGSTVAGGRSAVRARVHAIAEAYVRFALEHPSHFRVMFGPRLDLDKRRPFPALEAEVQRSFQVLVDEVEAAAKSGLLVPGTAVDHALGLWTMTHGYASLVLTRRIQVKPAMAVQYFGQLFATLLDGVMKATR
jgi:AcrR family transcriptional regulator